LCGITCLYTKNFTKKEKNIFLDVLKRNESRGGDSVGLYVYNYDTKKESLIYTLKKSSKPIASALNRVFKKIQNDNILLLAHTRLTATGTKNDYHPATYYNKKYMVHNGVMDSMDFNPRNNDTYEAIKLFEEQGLKPKLRNKIHCNGSAWIIFDKQNESLNIGKIGYNPLQILFKKNSIFIASVGLEKYNGRALINYENHFLKLDNENLKFSHVEAYVGESDYIYYSDSFNNDGTYKNVKIIDDRFKQLEKFDNEVGGEFYNNKTGCFNCWNCGSCKEYESEYLAYSAKMYMCEHCKGCNQCYEEYILNKKTYGD